MIARATLWGTIQLGEGFYKLTPREQEAVLAHERGHIAHRHIRKRLWWIVTLRAIRNPDAYWAMCEAQELEADRYAAEQGHAAGMVSFLFRLAWHVKSDGYPTVRRRIEAIHV